MAKTVLLRFFNLIEERTWVVIRIMIMRTFLIREIGADNFVLSNKAESMNAAAKSLDLILNTVSADHDLASLIGGVLFLY